MMARLDLNLKDLEAAHGPLAVPKDVSAPVRHTIILNSRTPIRRTLKFLVFGLLALVVHLHFSLRWSPKVHQNVLPDLYEASIAEIQEGLEKGMFTSVDLVKVRQASDTIITARVYNIGHSLQAYFARIDEVNLKGPMLRAILEVNPSALEQAAVLDVERKTSGSRGPLHGIPILLKDNIATMISDGEFLT
jgi:hypothetical protein